MADSPKVPLTDKPGVTNWVERTGALKPKGTNWIRRAAEHMKGKGMPEGQAIATAVNAAKKMCASGDTNFPGAQQVNAGSRAQACAAVAKWEAAKAKAKADRNLSATTAFAVIDLAKVRLEHGEVVGVVQPDPGEVIELAFNPGQARDVRGRWRATVVKAQALSVGEGVKVGRSFKITKVAAKGDRKYRVTMKGPTQGRAAGDQHVYVGTAVEAADAAHGISPAAAERQASKPNSKLDVDTLIANFRVMHGKPPSPVQVAKLKKAARSRRVSLSVPSREVVDLAATSDVAAALRKRTSTKRSVAQRAQRTLEGRILDALRKRPELKGKSDTALRAAAKRGAARALNRRRARQTLGIGNVNQASTREKAALRNVGLLPGSKMKAGTVVSHTITRGRRKGQTVQIRIGRGGSWSEVKGRKATV